MRLLWLFLAGSAGVYASSFASVSCTLGTYTESYTSSSTAAFCGLNYPGDPNNLPGGDIQAQTYLGYLSVGASAGVYPTVPASANASAGAYETETENFASGGAPRLGTIEFVISGGQDEAGPIAASISDGVHQYSLDCDELSCSTPDPPFLMPFNLGTPFTVMLAASASGSGGCINCPGGGDSGVSVDLLQLFESDGTTPVNYFPVTIPEPSPRALLLLALPVAWKFKQRSRERVV